MLYSNSYQLLFVNVNLLPCYSALCTEVAFCQPILYEHIMLMMMNNVLSIIMIIIIHHLYSAMGSYWDTEALVVPVKTV